MTAPYHPVLSDEQRANLRKLAEARHTPGPWRISKNATVSIPFRGAHCVAHAYAGTQANAHLIAAAPDLYEALFRLVPADFSEHPGDFADDWHAAVVALAKARGEA